MVWSLVLTPSGNLRLAEGEGASSQAGSSSPLDRIAASFRKETSAGLFALAAQSVSGGLPPVLAYWRDFACRYLTDRCHTPAGAGAMEPIPSPSDADIARMVLGMPPMAGGEYLTPEILACLWESLDAWVRREAGSFDGGLAAFLKTRAPLWHQVGRVCFHLAENKKNPDYPFAFLATYAPGVSTAARVRYQPLSRALQEFAGERNRNALVHLLTPINQVAGKSELIRELVDSGDIYHPLEWTPPEAYGFLQEIPLYEESGVLVRVPDWWARRSRPTVTVRIGSSPRPTIGRDALLDFDVQVAVGGDALTDQEWKALLAGSDGLVMLKGQWVELDRQRLQEALAHWRQVEATVAEGGISFVEGMRLLAGAPANLARDGESEEHRAWSHLEAGRWLGDVLDRLRAPGGATSNWAARGLRTTLRPYQESGVHWLRLLGQLRLGACLADDMGLGKTIQLLALLLAMRDDKESGPALLVLPASLLSNWKAEIERFAPSLRACFLHPALTPSHEIDAIAADPSRIAGADMVLTTYGMLPRQPWLESIDWRLVVLDEAQAIKNPSTRQTHAVKKLKARARVALTGTPVENRLSDLWSLFDFLCPGLLGTAARFKDFVRDIEQGDGPRYAPLRNLVRPYILRRLKTDRSVIADLPDKTEVRAFCGLRKSQAVLYEKAVNELATALETVDGIQRRGLVLAYLLRLKQICNHPSQVRGDGRYQPDESGKFARLAELSEEIASRQDKALIFTQFRELTEPLAAFLAGVFGRPGLVLHGQTPVKKRQDLVDSFQTEDGPPFFVLSLKAGGTGLNLTAASHVIHFDRWWNPAVENQATDRAFRIGQKRNVLVHKFVCQGTVEEKIDALIEEKTALARDILEGGGEALLTEMSNERLLATVALDIDRATV